MSTTTRRVVLAGVALASAAFVHQQIAAAYRIGRMRGAMEMGTAMLQAAAQVR